jgi:hypothetical protein
MLDPIPLDLTLNPIPLDLNLNLMLDPIPLDLNLNPIPLDLNLNLNPMLDPIPLDLNLNLRPNTNTFRLSIYFTHSSLFFEFSTKKKYSRAGQKILQGKGLGYFLKNTLDHIALRVQRK